LPQPEGPIRTVNPFFGTFKLKYSNMESSLKLLFRFLTESILKNCGEAIRKHSLQDML